MIKIEREIIIGTRGSNLALAQAEIIKNLLSINFPNIIFKIKTIVTSGDKDLKSNWENSDVSLKAFFTKEIEQELLDEKIDIAVHSMKDMPILSPSGLICGAIPKREDVRDVLISRENKFFPLLPKQAKIGTSSLRRSMNLKNVRKDLDIQQLRGNVNTRIKKLENGEYDAIVLAAAGLKRLDLEDKITEYLNPEIFFPAPGQGALYVQCREKDFFVRDLLKTIHDEQTEKIVKIEREFSKIFDGGCHTPLGCFSKIISENEIEFTIGLFKNEKLIKEKVNINFASSNDVILSLSQKIKDKMSEEEK